MASAPGKFVYTPAVGEVLPAGTHTLTVDFTPNDRASFTKEQATVSIVVNKAMPVISWPTPAAMHYGAEISAAQLNATASVPGKFTYAQSVGEKLPAGVHTLTTTFTPADTAGYSTTQATVSITVAKVATEIAWSKPAAIVYGDALSDRQLNAQAAIPGRFTYSPSAGEVLTAGEHTLTVNFTPDDSTSYVPAQATVSLTVTKATPSITWATPKAITYGTALSGTQLNASSSVAGKFTYSPVSGTVLTAGSHSLSVTFAPTDSADYATATDSMTLVVNKATPTVKLTSSASSIVVGKTLTFTATLTGSGVAPTGTASFFDGSTQLGASPPNGSGVATYSTSKLAVGKHSITTSYGGDENYNGATSTVVSVTVTAN